MQSPAVSSWAIPSTTAQAGQGPSPTNGPHRPRGAPPADRTLKTVAVESSAVPRFGSGAVLRRGGGLRLPAIRVRPPRHQFSYAALKERTAATLAPANKPAATVTRAALQPPLSQLDVLTEALDKAVPLPDDPLEPVVLHLVAVAREARRAEDRTRLSDIDELSRSPSPPTDTLCFRDFVKLRCYFDHVAPAGALRLVDVPDGGLEVLGCVIPAARVRAQRRKTVKLVDIAALRWPALGRAVVQQRLSCYSDGLRAHLAPRHERLRCDQMTQSALSELARVFLTQDVDHTGHLTLPDFLAIARPSDHVSVNLVHGLFHRHSRTIGDRRVMDLEDFVSALPSDGV